MSLAIVEEARRVRRGDHPDHGLGDVANNQERNVVLIDQIAPVVADLERIGGGGGGGIVGRGRAHSRHRQAGF